MHKTKYAIVLLVFILLGILLFIVVNQLRGVTEQKSLQKVTVQLAWLDNPQFAGMYIAKEKGFYEEAGLDVTLKGYEDGVNQIDDVHNGKATFAVSTPVEVLPARQSGKNIKAIAVVYQTAPMAFASLKSANIKSPADFEGKRLAAKGNNFEGKIKYIALLNKYNIPVDKANVIALDYSMDEADDLTKGRTDVIDLYRVDQPYLMREKGVSFDLLLPENYGVTGYGDVLIASDAMIKSDPALVEQFVKASMKGWEYTVNNPEEALAVSLKYAHADYKDEGRARFILEQSLPLIKPTGALNLGGMSFIIWNETARKMVEAGVLEQGIDVTEAFTKQFTQ